MKKSLTFFFCIITLIAFSQSNYYKIQGSWIACEILQKNTNEIFGDFYMKFTFKDSSLYLNSIPTCNINKNPLHFEVKGDLIKTSIIGESGYTIEKISKDTLIIADSFFNDKAKRFLLINELTLIENNLKKHENEEILIANKYCTPSQKKNINELIFETFKGKIKKELKIEGIIKINLLDKNIETNLSSDAANVKRLKKLKEILDKSYDYWDLTLFYKFKYVVIPFVFEVKKVRNFESLSIHFF